jgi:hypothetical protein
MRFGGSMREKEQVECRVRSREAPRKRKGGRCSFTVAAAHLRVASAFQRNATVGILRPHS